MGKIPTFTREYYEDVANSIDDGSYFKEARSWYTVVYMTLIPERCQYIVMMAIAGVTGFLAMISLAQLLPVAPAEPLLLPMKDVVREMPVIKPLRDSPYQPVNDALQRFFLKEYIIKRESYNFAKIQSNLKFLANYSSKEVMDIYQRYINPSSPRSPIKRYQRKAERKVEIVSIDIKRLDGMEEDWQTDGSYMATVHFEANLYDSKGVEVTDWEAQVTFDYTQLKMVQPEDQKTGELKVTPMNFTVIDYLSVEKIPANDRSS